MAKILITFFLLFLLSSCGFEGEHPEQMTPPETEKTAPIPKEAFACGTAACDYAEEYCLLTTRAKKVTYQRCVKAAEPERSCEWAKRDAKDVQMKKADNCRHEIRCIESGEKIKVTCVLP